MAGAGSGRAGAGAVDGVSAGVEPPTGSVATGCSGGGVVTGVVVAVLLAESDELNSWGTNNTAKLATATTAANTTVASDEAPTSEARRCTRG